MLGVLEGVESMRRVLSLNMEDVRSLYYMGLRDLVVHCWTCHLDRISLVDYSWLLVLDKCQLRIDSKPICDIRNVDLLRVLS